MLTAQETQIVMEKFFNECVRFWKSTGLDDRNAFEYAIKDARNLKRNPYVPSGDEIDLVTKEQFIKYREMDLGRR